MSELTITPGQKYLVDSPTLRLKYGATPIITIEGRWTEIRGGGPPLTESLVKIGALWTLDRMKADGLTRTQTHDDANIWYGHINGLGEGVHTSELRPLPE